MKKLLNRLTAVTSVCVLALCGAVPAVSAEDIVEVNEITISFDCSAEDIQLKDEYAEMIQPVKITPKSSITIPEAFPTREGYYFTGWTYDGIHAYTYGDTFRSPDGNDVTLTPVWTAKDDKNKYTINYLVEINGEVVDTAKKLPDTTLHAGQIFEVSLENFMRDDAAQFGWTFDEYEFRGQEKFVMPAHDITLTPNWKMRYKITYTVGDVDRVTGASFMEYIQPETIDTGLQNDKRFSRNGFKIVGWLCDDDNKIYAPSMPNYTMPSHDVTFTAVWEAKEYTVVFKQDKSSSHNIKIKGFTDTTITTPEATITQDGKYLSGWKDDDTGEFFPVGSEYMIMGAIEGKGITLTAVWEEGTPPTTSTTVTTQTTTTTTTETTTTTSTTNMSHKEHISAEFEDRIKEINTDKKTVEFENHGFYNISDAQLEEFLKIGTGNLVKINFDYNEDIFISNGYEEITRKINFINSMVAVNEKEDTKHGDANEDGEVNISDAVLIMQVLSNPNDYKFTEQGQINADVVGNDGVTAQDALAIQMMGIKLLTAEQFPLDKLPEIAEK